MKAPAGSPLRPSPDERRERLARHFLEVLQPLLREHAYAELSVERIIRAGSISRASFYAYFADKTDLLAAMAEHLVDALGDLGERWWTMDESAGRETLRAGLRDILEAWRTHRVLLRAVTEGALQDAGIRRVYDTLVASSTAALEAHIRAGQAGGSIAPVPPRETAELLVHLGERSLYEFIGVDDVQADAAFLDPLTDVVWRTLYEGYR